MKKFTRRQSLVHVQCEKKITLKLNEFRAAGNRSVISTLAKISSSEV